MEPRTELPSCEPRPGARGDRGTRRYRAWSPCSVLQPSAALFEACCSDRIQPFDDDEEEDIWEDEETRCTARVVARARCRACPTSQVPHRRGQAREQALDTVHSHRAWHQGWSHTGLMLGLLS